jgi:hypothetical protein
MVRIKFRVMVRVRVMIRVRVIMSYSNCVNSENYAQQLFWNFQAIAVTNCEIKIS